MPNQNDSRITVGDITEIREGDEVYVYANFYDEETQEVAPLKMRGTVITYPIEELYNSNNNSNNNSNINTVGESNDYTLAVIGIDEIILNNTDRQYEVGRAYVFGMDVIRLDDYELEDFLMSDVDDIIEYEEKMIAKYETNNQTNNQNTYNYLQNTDPISIQNGGRRRKTEKKQKRKVKKIKKTRRKNYRHPRR